MTHSFTGLSFPYLFCWLFFFLLPSCCACLQILRANRQLVRVCFTVECMYLPGVNENTLRIRLQIFWSPWYVRYVSFSRRFNYYSLLQGIHNHQCMGISIILKMKDNSGSADSVQLFFYLFICVGIPAGILIGSHQLLPTRCLIRFTFLWYCSGVKLLALPGSASSN